MRACSSSLVLVVLLLCADAHATDATVTITNLDQVYSGQPKPVTVATDPAGLSVLVTYNGSNTVPSAPGSYSVVASVTATNYRGSASATETISSASTSTSASGTSAAATSGSGGTTSSSASSSGSSSPCGLGAGAGGALGLLLALAARRPRRR